MAVIILRTLQLALQLRDHAIHQLAGALQFAASLCDLQLGAGLVQLFLQLLAGRQAFLLALPLRGQVGALALQFGQLHLQLLQPVARGGIGLLLQRFALDLQLDDLAVQLVDFLRLGIDLHAQPAAGLVHQIDGLVGQEAVGDIAVGELCRRDDGAVGDAHAVMQLVLLLQPAQDGDGLRHRGFGHEHRLEAPRQGGVLFHMLAVLVQCRGTDAMQLAACQGRLQHVGGVHRAIRLAGTHQRVHLVDEQDDLAGRRRDFAQHRFQSLLELAAELGAGDQRPQVERQQPAVLQRLRHVAIDDALGQPLDDGGLADAGLADQHGIVLGAA